LKLGEFKADLHLHSNSSDGAKSPASMVQMAAKLQMAVVSITDHDTVLGVDEAMEAGRKNGVVVIPGVEISTGDGEEIHILAYAKRLDHRELLSMLGDSLRDRQERMREMLRRLKTLGLPIEPEEAFNKENDFTGRMNVALAMVSHGYVSSVREAFDRYLGINRPAFVPRKRMLPVDAIGKLASYGCTVALAHPGRLLMGREALLTRLPGFIDAGLSAIEAYHPSHSDDDARFYNALAIRKNLQVTGGSDCHGRAARGTAKIGDHLRQWSTVREDTEALLHRIETQALSR
jgi:hypothetical protein